MKKKYYIIEGFSIEFWFWVYYSLRLLEQSQSHLPALPEQEGGKIRDPWNEVGVV